MSLDYQFMVKCLQLAHMAMIKNEVPVGAICTIDETMISQGVNQTLTLGDPCAHAEILALQKAAKVQNNHRLPQITLYVTLEPCLMCVGAMLQARIKRLVYGCADLRFGVFSKQDLFEVYSTNHQFEVTSSILAQESGKLLSKFFQDRRGK